MLKPQHKFLTVFLLVLGLLSAQWAAARHVHEQDLLHQHVSDCTLGHFQAGNPMLLTSSETPLLAATCCIEHALPLHFYSGEFFAHFQGRAPPSFFL